MSLQNNLKKIYTYPTIEFRSRATNWTPLNILNCTAGHASILADDVVALHNPHNPSQHACMDHTVLLHTGLQT